MIRKNARIGVFILTAITALALAGCPGTETPGPSGEKQILTFTVTVGGKAVQGDVNQTAHTVTLILPQGTVVTALAPAITVSEGAAVSPASGTAQDFTDPVAYRVTAEDATTQDYTATAVVLLPLDEAIDAANAAVAEVVVSVDGTDVDEGEAWVTAEVKAALEAAIAEAEAMLADPDATDEEKEDAAKALTLAMTRFNEAKETKSGTAADKTALNAAITAANTAKTGVLVDSSEANVPEGALWVTKTVSDTFNAAITAAQAVAAKAASTQAEVDKAETDLKAATETFTKAKQTAPPADKTALDAAIAAAKAAKTGILVNTSAGNVLTGNSWVTQGEMDALDAAIDAAETEAEKAASAQAEVDKAETDLKAATETFTKAKKAGTKAVGSVNITLKAPADMADEAEDTLSITTVTIYQQGGEDNDVTITAELSELSGATVAWFLDNKSLGTNNSVTLTAADLLPGGHHLSLEVTTTDEAVWSRELTVIVDSGSK
jgi:hypothetical protein